MVYEGCLMYFNVGGMDLILLELDIVAKFQTLQREPGHLERLER